VCWLATALPLLPRRARHKQQRHEACHRPALPLLLLLLLLQLMPVLPLLLLTWWWCCSQRRRCARAV